MADGVTVFDKISSDPDLPMLDRVGLDRLSAHAIGVRA